MKEKASSISPESTCMQYRLWNTVHQHYGTYENLREAKIDCKSVDENYGDFVTFQVTDSAYLYIPAYRVLSSEKQSLWDQLFKKKKEFLSGVTEADWSQGLEGHPLLKKYNVHDNQIICNFSVQQSRTVQLAFLAKHGSRKFSLTGSLPK